MRRRALLIPLALLAGCSPKGGSAAGSADSTATPPPDSAAMARDSVRLDSAALADSAGAKSKAPALTVPGKVIGRDSAFGPRYRVDSTGKLIPIPQKRP